MEIFESVWSGDHFYATGGPDLTVGRFEAWTLLTAVAQATQRLRVGVLVSAMVNRHPAVVANMAATVDAISNGRFELGLGAGWKTEEFAPYGIKLGTIEERFDRFEEGLQVIDSLLTKELTNFDGRYYQLTDARCEPKPIQSPRPPFTMGGYGERRTLPLVARFADHWNFPPTHRGEGPGGARLPETIRHRNLDALNRAKEVLAAECQEIGRDMSEIRISTTVRARDGLDAIAEQAEMFQQAGIDLLVIAPLGHNPDDLELIGKTVEPFSD
jgi:alkanesulfonate monooxygenase SsuD/methylene tetrahydromethanopterin reductase-like flavin-dependent oxidoreductase (luciferase family)